MTILKSWSKKFLALIFAMTMVSGLFQFAGSSSSILTGTVTVEAQSGTFENCNFRDAENNPNAFQDCLGTIFQFVVAISFLLILFRIGLAALNSYNPLGGGGSPVNNAVTIVWDIVLGLLFIGGPILILGTLNPALLNFQIIDITPITGSNNSGNGSEDSDGTSSSEGSNSGANRDSGLENSINIINGSKTTKKNETGDDVALENSDFQAAADELNALKPVILECHRILRPVSTNCGEWDGFSTEEKQRRLEGKRVIESSSQWNQDVNTASHNTGITNQNGPYKVTSGSMKLTFVDDNGDDSPDKTTQPNINDCDRYLLEFNTITGYETFGNGNEFVDLPELPTAWFNTEICTGDISNTYFSINVLDGVISFKGDQTFDEGDTVLDLRRDNRNPN